MEEQSKVAATIHEQCMNSNRNYSSPTETRLEKKKGVKRKRKTQNVYPNPTVICSVFQIQNYGIFFFF